MNVGSAEMLGTRAQETWVFEVSERRLSFLTTRPLHHVFNCLSHEPAQDYHIKAGAFLSSHLLAKYRQGSSRYHKATQGLLEQEERPAYLVGKP